MAGPGKRLLTSEGAGHLRAYTYVGADHSLLYKHVFSPWAQFCVDTFTPLSAAPNLITLLGFCWQVAGLCIAAYYAPNFSEPVPRWVPVFCAVALFIYQTMDNMDGKQARRTGTSSALGMLFDHACDAVNTGLVGTVSVGIALRVGAVGSGTFLGLLAFTTLPFFFIAWEELHTGRFELPIINGPNEALTITMGVLIAAGVWGEGAVSGPAAAALPPLLLSALDGPIAATRWLWPPRDPGAAVTTGEAALSLLNVLMVITLLSHVAAVASELFRRSHKAAAAASHHHHRLRGAVGFAAALGDLWPVVALNAATLAWLHSPVLARVLDGHLPAFVGAYGSLFALSTCKAMFAHVSGQAFQPAHAGFLLLGLPPAVLAAEAAVGPMHALTVLADAVRGHAAELLLFTAASCLAGLAYFLVAATAEVAAVLDVDILSISRQLERQAAAPPAVTAPHPAPLSSTSSVRRGSRTPPAPPAVPAPVTPPPQLPSVADMMLAFTPTVRRWGGDAVFRRAARLLGSSGFGMTADPPPLAGSDILEEYLAQAQAERQQQHEGAGGRGRRDSHTSPSPTAAAAASGVKPAAAAVAEVEDAGELDEGGDEPAAASPSPPAPPTGNKGGRRRKASTAAAAPSGSAQKQSRRRSSATALALGRTTRGTRGSK